MPTKAQLKYWYSKETIERLKKVNPNKKVNIPKEKLKELYLFKKLTLKEIGKIFGVHRKTVARRCKEYNIPLRYIHEPRKFDLKETDFAYLAGLIDGEGTITIVKRPKGKGGFRPVISIGNTKKEILNYAASVFGVAKPKGFSVQMTKINDILTFLSRILPYLKLKRKQAEILIEFCKVRAKNIKRGSGRLYWSGEEEKLWKAIKKYNKRGDK